ncbi:UNVERIFIED_CONTAM: hypothetical protein Sradi_5535300 [Sesamum radiatum]|uniref:Uncharacterized protein n=1 Tax=Sesamum radiatum TaxID=300843 RepID=A0AAW2LFP8_SESRA
MYPAAAPLLLLEEDSSFSIRLSRLFILTSQASSRFMYFSARASTSKRSMAGFLARG